MFLLEQVYDVPLGVRLLNKIPFVKCIPYNWKNYCHKFNVLLLTFLSYASYHLARKPTSVVKNVLYHKNCSAFTPPSTLNVTSQNELTWCNWHPFDGSDASTLLGTLDSVFLFAYAFGMFATGPIGERMNLRYFLSFGMIVSGFFGFLFGLAYWTEIHSLSYFLFIQIVAGFFQSTGWPGNVAVVGNWFGKSKRGFIMGIWRSHHSVGNIFGTIIAAAFVEHSWGLSFTVPAAIMISIAIIVFLFLVPDPRAVGCPIPDHTGQNRESQNDVVKMVVNSTSDDPTIALEFEKPSTQILKSLEREKPITFWRAIRIPGVLEYASSLFFTKLINYTFLYWLPVYINGTGLNVGAKSSADLSTLFDIGGIFGGIIAGLISDMTGMSALTCGGSFLLTVPLLFFYRLYGSSSVEMNIFLLFVVGLLANGPYALITTSVSADLGTHPDLKGSTRALATVTAIIDGTGSIGAAIGPLMAGPLSTLGWDYVFYALMLSSLLGLLILSRLMIREIKNATCFQKHGREGTTENSHKL